MKFRKKSWLAFLLMVVMSLVLTACGGGNDDKAKKDDSGDDGGGKKITIFQSKVEISDQLEALAKEYEKETGVKVEIWGTTGDDYFQQLQIKLNSDQGPSIFTLEGLRQAQKLKSYVADLSDAEFVANIAPKMELKMDDKVVGLPYGVEGFGIVYNKDLVKPEDVKDYDSFVSTLQSLKKQGINPFGLSQEAYFLIGHMSNYPFSLQEDNYAFIDKMEAGDVTMAETPEFKEFSKFMEAIREYSNSPLDVTYDEEIGDFATGKTAMIHQGNWAATMLADYDLDFEVGMMPFPLAGNDKLAVGVGAYWAVNGTKDDAEVQAAVDFLNWMVSSETGQKYIVEEFGFVPAMTNIEANNLDPLSQAVLEASNSGETIPWSHSYYPPNLIVNDFTPATQQFFLNKDITGDQFIKSLDNAFQNAIK
ncbi:ABC transporter substrate-binding protein [Caldifermentibacillus hisashii]|uniref:sugar ABC transporter substrate-binding protein n=1 Tax=Caldifermentibacillus hisashii TaxID=996558 RepID=UPI002E205E6C|nr:ABC transporter substrate-binding protein [Caldifermentibacillus hisashii]